MELKGQVTQIYYSFVLVSYYGTVVPQLDEKHGNIIFDDIAQEGD